MNEYVQIIILGVLQGIAEFLPISSSGHLVLVRTLLQETTGKSLAPGNELAIDVALHLGTLASILLVYFRDLVRLPKQPKLVIAVVLASIPAAVAGFVLKDHFRAAFSTPGMVGFSLLITACLLLIGQRVERNRFTGGRIPYPIALVIGLFQACAVLFPGISRAGSTICGGLISGVDRETATRFSFLMAIVAISGAGALTFKDVVSEGQMDQIPWAVVALGVVISFAVGTCSLKLLIRLINKNQLHWFALYCATVGVAAIVWQAVDLTPKAMAKAQAAASTVRVASTQR